MSTNKRKPKNTTGLRTRTKGGYDKNMITEGVYANARWTHTFTSLIGCVVQVQVKNGGIYEGILKTFSPKMEIVLEMAHKWDGEKYCHPTKDRLIEKLIFKHSDVVTMTASNIDLDYAIRDNFTDAAISKFNGQVTTTKEFQPWEADTREEEAGSLGLELDNSSQNGWDAAEMFRTNAEQFNVKSTYDSSLQEYTTPLEYNDSPEFREKEAKAQKLAQEIEQSEQYKARIELENNDEDEKLSAVVRSDGSNTSVNSGGSGKYVAPGMRKNTQQNRTTKAAGSSSTQPLPVKQDISPEEEKNRKNISANPVECKNNKSQTPTENTAAPEKSKSRDMSPAVTESNGDSGVNPSPAMSPEGKPGEQKKSPVSQKMQNDKQLAELKEFSMNFKLNEKKEEEQKKESPADEHNDDVADLSETVKKSTLNPNAKEFIFCPKAFPQQQKQPTQISTPPRPQTQSPVLPQAQAINPMAGYYQTYNPQYMMPAGHIPSMPQTAINPAPQPTPQRTKRAVVSVQPTDFNPAAQAVNATGTPILAQAAPQPLPNQPQYQIQYVPQMIGQPAGATTHGAPSHMAYQPSVMQIPSGHTRLMNPQNHNVGATSHPQGMNNPAAMQQHSGTPVFSLSGPMHGQVPTGPQQQGGPQPQQQAHHPSQHYQQHHQSRATPPHTQSSHPAPSPAHQPNAPPPQAQHPHQGYPPSSTPTQMMYPQSQHMAQQHPPLQPSPHTPTSPQAVPPTNMPYSYGQPIQNHGAQQMALAHIPHTTVSYSTAQAHHTHTHQTHQNHMIVMPPGGPHGGPGIQHGHQQMQPPPMQGPPVHAERHRFPSVPASTQLHQSGHHMAAHAQQTLASQGPPPMSHHPPPFTPQMHAQNPHPVQAFQPNP